MSTALEKTSVKEELFAGLEEDGIEINAATINKAKQGDGYSLWSIGYIYHDKKVYAKALAWYQLSADKNHSYSQYHIGMMYHNEEGVSADYLLAMEWFIKAARQHHKQACASIGDLFEKGQGVPVNKYKALEWYCKVRKNAAGVTTLNKQGFHIIKQDENKSMEQLISETEDIIMMQKQRAKNKSNSIIKNRDTSPTDSLSNSNNLINGELTVRLEQGEEDEEEEKESNNTNEGDMHVLQTINRQKQQELELLKKTLKNYKREIQNMEKVIDVLNQRNFMFVQQLEAKDSTINALENELCVLDTAPPHAKKTAEFALQQGSNQALICQSGNRPLSPLQDNEITFLKHEIQALRVAKNKEQQESEEKMNTLKELLRSKRIEIKLLKQNMELKLFKERHQKRKLESENKRLKIEMREYDILIQTTNTTSDDINIKSDDDNDEIDSDTELDNYENRDDILTYNNTPDDNEESNDAIKGKQDDDNTTICKMENKKRRVSYVESE